MNRNLYISILLLAVCTFTGCSDKDDPSHRLTGSKGAIGLVIADHRMTQTKAASGIEDAEPGEFEITGDVDIYIYDTNGRLEYKNQLPVDREGRTPAFYVSTGVKKIYLFANRPAGSIVDPAPGTTISEFDNDIIQGITFGTDHNRPVELATAGQFGLGTLWDGNQATITGEGMLNSPQRLRVDIGRIAAKIRLELVLTDSELLKGTFGPDFLYTVRSVPTRTYLLGKYDNSTAHTVGAIPPAPGIQFISAVHTESPLDGEIQNPLFTNYNWPEAGVVNNIGQSYYTVENTSKPLALTPGGEEYLYYGNTTYITLRTTYTPGAEDEFRDGANPTRTVPYTGGNFWIGTYQGTRHAFATQPIHMDVEYISECRDGVMYYHIPVRDQTELSLEKSCAIVRNHFYKIEILGFKNWGSGNPVEPPQKPIEPDETNGGLYVRFTIEPWYRINQGVDL